MTARSRVRTALAAATCIVVGAVLVGLALVGAASLIGEPRLAAQEGPRGRVEGADGARTARAARGEPGPYLVPSDPLIAYVLRPAREVTLAENRVGMTFRTDALGLRARGAPEPAPGAPRIVVLGDSVAFGLGLDEPDALAAQLERELAAAGVEPAPACFGVALPSWNARNAWRFLLDHLAHFRPDVVLYLPVDNDLDDGYGVTEAGDRRTGEDPCSEFPLLDVRPEWGYLGWRLRELRAAGTEPDAVLGPRVLYTGASPLSRARLAVMVDVIAGGARRMERAGARVALVPYERSDFHVELRAELVRAGVALPEIPLLERLLDEDTLGIDPHPAAATVGAFARWLAADLVQRGWVADPGPEGRAALARDPRGIAGRRAAPLTDADALERSAERRARTADELRARVEPETLEGILQVYGGLNLDGTFEPEIAAALAPGRTLAVRLAPIAERPDLYPLEVEVHAGGRLVGVVTVPAEGAVERELALGAEEAASAFDVRLVARDWAVVTVRGRSWVAAARLLLLESRP